MSKRKGRQRFGRQNTDARDKSIKPKMGFDIEEMSRASGSYAVEVTPVGKWYAFRFFNEVESVMMLGTEEFTRQVHAEIGNALGIGRNNRRARKGLQVKGQPEK